MTKEEAIDILQEDIAINKHLIDTLPSTAAETFKNDILAYNMAIKSLEAWESLRKELKYELCKKVHEKDSYIPCPNQTTSCSYTGLRIYELNNIINHVIDKHLKEVSE